jgi:hypothetical protein
LGILSKGNNNIQALENQDNFIQSLSIDRLREIESQSKCLFLNDKLLQENSFYEDLRYSNIDEYPKYAISRIANI